MYHSLLYLVSAVALALGLFIWFMSADRLKNEPNYQWWRDCGLGFIITGAVLGAAGVVVHYQERRQRQRTA